MKIQIQNSEAEIDVDLLADELSSSIESAVDSFVSSAVDDIDISNDVYDAVREHDFDYDIERALDAYCWGNIPEIEDLSQRVEKLEMCIERMTQAMPSTELDKITLERDQWVAKFEQLESKFLAIVGLEKTDGESEGASE